MNDFVKIDLSKEYLKIVFIDVGWGDSIYVETRSETGKLYRILVDSNDSLESNSSKTFLRRYFEKQGLDIANSWPIFDLILLSHDHADHAKGLKGILSKFGSKHFWYSASDKSVCLQSLIKYCNRVGIRNKLIDSSTVIKPRGDLEVEVIWPPKNTIDANENNNSIVLKLTFKKVVVYLTGDAETDVWNVIGAGLNHKANLFKVPHHGSENGTIDPGNTLPWLHSVSQAALVISSHVRPFGHPDKVVTDLFDQMKRKYFRTDVHHIVTFLTDGKRSGFTYTHSD